MSEIISRTEWGAQYADGTGERPVGALIRILHHTGDADPVTEEPLPPTPNRQHAGRGHRLCSEH